YRIWQMDEGWSEWMPYSEGISFEEECMHYLEIKAMDCLGNYVIDNETFYVDDTAPEIIKTVGDPQCMIEEDVYCVTMSTPITVDATELGCCPCTDVTIEYRIWYDDEWTDWMPYSEAIYFTEECEHQLEIRAWDCLGNMATDLETFYVDETPPELEKTVGQPHFYLGLDEFGHDVWLVYPGTPITFTAEDMGCCPCTDSTIMYRYWYLGQWTDWMEYTEEIHFSQGCIHYLEAYAIDCLGNMGDIDNETFWVCAPGGGDPDEDPTIDIIEPEDSATICDQTVDVLMHAEDEQTSWENLNVFLKVIEQVSGTTMIYPAEPTDTEGYFTVPVDIYKYNYGTHLIFEAMVIDEDGNDDTSAPVIITVCSTTQYDQWLDTGWNQFSTNYVGCDESIERVFESIEGCYDLIAHYDQQEEEWISYWINAPENELTTIQSGKQYWVHSTCPQPVHFYISAPEITIDHPENGSIITELPSIYGTAWDSQNGVQQVYIQITYMEDSTTYYWDDNAMDWTTTQTNLMADLTTGYHQEWTYDSSEINWIDEMNYIITAMAEDSYGCFGYDSVQVSVPFLGEAAVNIEKQVWIPQEFINEPDTEGYVTYVFTLADIVLFGYEEDTALEIYDDTDDLVWSGTVNDGEYHIEGVSQGVYKIVGGKKFSVLVGDPITNSVMGYYAVDNNGYGASTKLYTYMPNIYDGIDDDFIVFSYTDGTEVTVTNMDTDTEHWSGTLNEGEHYSTKDLSDNFIKVEANYPVSALSYTDQGYAIPAANQRFSGQEFYTFAYRITDQPNTLHVMSYEDNTQVLIKNTETEEEYFNGILNAGEETTIASMERRFYTIQTDKDVTAAVLAPFANYHHGTYMGDKTGSGIGTEFYSPIIGISQIQMVFAYENATTIEIYDAATGVLEESVTLDRGEYQDVNQGSGHWHLTSNNLFSLYQGYGHASASFAPVLFGEAVGGYWGETREATLEETVTFKLRVSNPGDILLDSLNVSDCLPEGLVYAGDATVNAVPMEPSETWNQGQCFAWIDPFQLAPGEHGEIIFNATVNMCDETLFNTGYVTDENQMVDDEDTASVESICEQITDYTFDKWVWRESMESWDEYTEDEGFEDIVRFNITLENTGDTTLEDATLVDHLPEGLEYVEESTMVKAIIDDTILEYSGTEVEPTITPGDGEMLLTWVEDSMYNLPPGGIVHLEFEAMVTVFNGDLTNIGMITIIDQFEDEYEDEDDADVWVYSECPP
ncbi:MAG: DUF11 domain-containing protein, partial [Candidatus Lokiarchaeota archaeon]|nr:DUF11 domain-containing protein [Candidatus Lokiarchaeota archaeon]